MVRTSRAARTFRTVLTDRGARAVALDLRAWARWAAVGTSRPGRGLGPLRRTPRLSCSLCGAPASLVLEPAYAATDVEHRRTYTCRRHVERLALSELAASGRPLQGFPPRLSWGRWWRSAPSAVAWRNAALLVPFSADDLVPVDVPPRPRGSALFAARRSLW